MEYESYSELSDLAEKLAPLCQPGEIQKQAKLLTNKCSYSKEDYKPFSGKDFICWLPMCLSSHLFFAENELLTTLYDTVSEETDISHDKFTTIFAALNALKQLFYLNNFTPEEAPAEDIPELGSLIHCLYQADQRIKIDGPAL